MLAKAGEAAPDWAGGTRIGAALRDFNDRYGVRGMARGAVILIISDGWETGDPALLGAQMARLHRIAYRIVWANPRTQSDGTGPRSAAWPPPGRTATRWSARTTSRRSTTCSRRCAPPGAPAAVRAGRAGPRRGRAGGARVWPASDVAADHRVVVQALVCAAVTGDLTGNIGST